MLYAHWVVHGRQHPTWRGGGAADACEAAQVREPGVPLRLRGRRQQPALPARLHTEAEQPAIARHSSDLRTRETLAVPPKAVLSNYSELVPRRQAAGS